MNRKAILAIAVAFVMVASGAAIFFGTGNSEGHNAVNSASTSPNSPVTNSAIAQQSKTGISDLNKAMSLAESTGMPMKYLMLPNFNSQSNVSNGHITLGYSASPAPMGIGSYGLKNVSGKIVPFNYTSSSYEANITLKNLSDFNIVDDSPQSVTFQLNAVLDNVALFGNSNYSMWTQNVFVYSARTHQISFEDNIWNFSSPTAVMSPNAINNSTGHVFPYAFAHIAIGPTVNVSYPFTVHLYLNTTVLNGESTVYFNYSIPSGSHHAKLLNGTLGTSGTYDRVEFNSTYGHPKYSAPAPAYLVSGTNLTPTGFIPYDAEIMVGGPGGGSTASIYNINGSMNLNYFNKTTSSYKAVPSAYDIGSETGETSVGVDVSYAGTTAYLNPGPSLVYGLWNVTVSQTTYSVTTTNKVTPFVFINNNETQLNENVISWAPMPSNTASFRLPTSTYTVEALLNYHIPGVEVLSSSGTTISLTAARTAGVYTPIIAMNNSQLKNVSVSGLGTTTSPYVINSTGTMNPVFGQLNDYLFPAFPGVLIMNTSSHVILNRTNMPVQYTGFSASAVNFFNTIYGTEMPTFNYLTTQIYNASNVTVSNGYFSTWFSFEQSGFYTASLAIWNSTNSVVTNNTFISWGDSLLIYNAPDQKANITVENNYFEGLSYLMGIAPLFDQAMFTSFNDGMLQNGLDMYSGHNLVLNNTFYTQTPAVDIGYNFYEGTPTGNYTNAWNNSVIGNFWWNSADNGSKYNNSGMINGYDYKPIIMPGLINITIVALYGGSVDAFAYDGFDLSTSPSASVMMYPVASGVPFSYEYEANTSSGLITLQSGIFNTSTPGTLGATGYGLQNVYSLTFAETGLASGTTWTVNVNGFTIHSSTSSLMLNVTNGSFTYTVNPISGYVSSISSGTTTISGSDSSVSLSFASSAITLTFTETGLASGTTWSITVNGVMHSYDTTMVNLTVQPGAFTYSIGNVSGYQKSSSGGSVVINGNTSISVSYTPNVSPGTSGGAVAAYVAASVIGGLVVGGVAIYVMLGRKHP